MYIIVLDLLCVATNLYKVRLCVSSFQCSVCKCINVPVIIKFFPLIFSCLMVLLNLTSLTNGQTMDQLMLVNCNLLQDHYLFNEFQLSTQCLDHSAIFGKKICLFDLADFDAGLKGTCNTILYLKTIFLADFKAVRRTTASTTSPVSWSLTGATSRSTTASTTSPVNWSLTGATSRSTTVSETTAKQVTTTTTAMPLFTSDSTPKMYKLEFSVMDQIVEIQTTNVYAYIFGSLASFVASSLFAYGLYWYKKRRATIKLQNRPFRFSDLLKNDRPPVVRVAPHVAISMPVNVTTPANNTPCRPTQPPQPPQPPPAPCVISIAPSRPSCRPPPPPQCPPPASSLPEPCFKLQPIVIEQPYVAIV